MKMGKLEEKENKSLERKEVTVDISFEGGTPKREEVKKELCAKVGANPDMSVLRKIQTTYGKSSLRAWLHVYNNVDKMKEVEPLHLLKRDKLVKEKPAEKKKEEPKKEKKKEAPKKEEKPAEKKPEDKKEEPKKEEKPVEKKKEEPKK